MKINLKEYTAGDLARFYGLSLDTIRFYDKKGILTAEKNTDNDYRIYSRADLISLDHILKLKNMGIPLNDVKNIINKYSIEETTVYCQDRIEKLYSELTSLKERISALENYTNALTQSQNNWNAITLEMCPTLYMKDISKGVASARHLLCDNGMYNDAKLIAYSGQSAKYYISNQILSKEERSTMADCYLGVPFLNNDKINLLEQGDWIWPKQLCIHSYFKSSNDPGNMEKELQKIQQFVEKHNFKLKGDTLCWILFTQKTDNQRIDYYDCWYTVELQ